MNFVMKRADIHNYKAMADVIQSVWLEINNKDWFVADDPEKLRLLLEEGNGLGYQAVEEESGALAGVFFVAFPGAGEENMGRDIGISEEELPKVAHMESVAILPEYRGHGLQYRLMLEGEEELKRRGYQYLMCTIHPDNQFSKNNAIRQGYEVMATKEKYGGFLRDILLKRI